MRSWPALLLAPLLALTQLSVAYSLVTPECAQQGRGFLHGVSLLSVVVVLAMTLLAWQAWRDHARGAVAATGGEARATTAADSDGASQRPPFVALIAVLVGSLATLVCVALWIPIWLLSPCY